MTNLDESLQRLFKRNLHIIKLDLEPMRALMEELGNPHQSFIAVHVAGTNGKGSVCAMLDAILREQGYRTGLYTSPHLVRFNERIRVDGNDIGDEELQALIDEVESAATRLPCLGFRDVTFFEFTTALAFLHFQRAGVEIAVVETGMGGRLDATNVLVPAVSVITSIGLEHQQYLGDTLAKIAEEKAGIVKMGRPVVMGNLPREAEEVVDARAFERNALRLKASEAVRVSIAAVSLQELSLRIASEAADYGTVRSGINGMHQPENAAMAVAVAECLDQSVGIPVDGNAIKAGIQNACWPARCQLLSDDPPVILDGGHNPDAAESLAAWLKKVAPGKPLGMIVGFLADKDPATFMRTFNRNLKKVWIVPVRSDRAMAVSLVKDRLSFIRDVQVCESLRDARREARAWARAEAGVVLVTGSLYLAGEVLAADS